MSKLTSSSTWQKLASKFEQIKSLHLSDFANQNPDRSSKYKIKLENLDFDYSKQRIDDETLALLIELARENNLEMLRDSMFSGGKINNTEGRAVLHTALRANSDAEIMLDGRNVMAEINAQKAKMKDFVEAVRTKKWRGYTGKAITDVVNIGIGGSDLGPRMAVKAMAPYSTREINFHFVSNVDGADIDETLRTLDPETTLFLVASKKFTTQETLTNAHTARQWFLDHAGMEKYIARHFVAMSANAKLVEEFGIDVNNMFEFGDYVGGRFSIWSVIGIPLAIAIGYDQFEDFLNGALSIDEHFKNEPLEKNIPVIMALTEIWNINFLKAKTHFVIPYSYYLSLLASYLQQLEMESNGKSVDKDGNPVDYETNTIIWGIAGTDAQHSVTQLILQGTQTLSADFIGFEQPISEIGDHHKLLQANFFGQQKAFTEGVTEEEVKAELSGQNLSEDEINFLAKHKAVKGNIPVNSFIFDKVTPFNLGRILALYEHKVFVQGVIWNINSFDQWGVELGKKLANEFQAD